MFSEARRTARLLEHLQLRHHQLNPQPRASDILTTIRVAQKGQSQHHNFADDDTVSPYFIRDIVGSERYDHGISGTIIAVAA